MRADSIGRRDLLRAAGVAGATALAGCAFSSDSDSESEESGGSEPAIDPDAAEVSDVLDAIESAYEDVSSYRTDGVEDGTIVMSELRGVDQIDEEQLLEEWDGVLFDRTEAAETTVDLDAEAYEQIGTERGEFLGTDVEREIREYHLDGTTYEYTGDDDAWEVSEDAEFDPPYDVVEFPGQAREVADEIEMELRDDGARVALLGSFGEIPDSFQDGEQEEGGDPFRLVTSYDFELVFSTDTGLTETFAASIEGDIDNVAILDLLEVVPSSAEGTFSIGQEAEFLAHDESVEIELPEDAPAE